MWPDSDSESGAERDAESEADDCPAALAATACPPPSAAAAALADAAAAACSPPSRAATARPTADEPPTSASGSTSTASFGLPWTGAEQQVSWADAESDEDWDHACPAAPGTPKVLEPKDSAGPAAGAIGAARNTHAEALAGEGDAAGGLIEDGITTLMIQNLPKHLLKHQLLEELDCSGFDAAYDFCYLPRCRNTGDAQGYAFVNFLSSVDAERLMRTWHKQRRFGMLVDDRPLSIVRAAIQGLKRNLAHWQAPRRCRINNPNYLPYVRSSDDAVPQVATTVGAEKPVVTKPRGTRLDLAKYLYPGPQHHAALMGPIGSTPAYG